MSNPTYQLPPAPSLYRASWLLWNVRFLLSQGAMDRVAARTIVRPLAEHPHDIVRRLAVNTLRTFNLIDEAIESVQVEAFAR